MANNQLQTSGLNELQQIGDFGVNELMTMKETIGKDLSIPQFNLFMYQCNRMGLDPALKHAFPILYGGKMDVRVSFEGLHAIARKSEGYEGLHMQVVCENEIDDFEAETDDEGVVVSVKHKIRFPRGKVVGAFAIAKRTGKKNVVVIMDASEVQKWVKKNGSFWKLDDGSIDPDMFKKHAGTRALKAQYDIALAVEENMEEMNSSSNIPEYRPDERRDVTPQPEVIDAPPKKELTEEEKQIKKLRNDISKGLLKLGITTKEAKAEYIAKNAPNMGDNPSIAELTGLLQLIDINLEMIEAQASSSDELEE